MERSKLLAEFFGRLQQEVRSDDLLSGKVPGCRVQLTTSFKDFEPGSRHIGDIKPNDIEIASHLTPQAAIDRHIGGIREFLADIAEAILKDAAPPNPSPESIADAGNFVLHHKIVAIAPKHRLSGFPKLSLPFVTYATLAPRSKLTLVFESDVAYNVVISVTEHEEAGEVRLAIAANVFALSSVGACAALVDYPM